MRGYRSSDAQRAIAAALAAQPTVKENVAVVDAGGQLVAFVRQDGAISAALYSARPLCRRAPAPSI